MKVVLVLLLGLCCSGLVSQEEEDPIKEFLEKVQERLYFPQDFGLKDLKATLLLEFSAKGMPPTVEVTLYWKHPNKWKLEFAEDTLERIKVNYGRTLKPDLEMWLICKKPLETYQEMKDTWKFRLKKENAQYILICTPTEKTRHMGIKEIRWLYDNDHLLVKQITTTQKGTITFSDFKYTTKEKKKLLSECIFTKEAGHGVDKRSVKLSYKQIDKIWPLKKMAIEIELKKKGQTTSKESFALTVEDPQVNKGIEDEIFEEEPEEEPEKELEENRKEGCHYSIKSFLFK